MLKKEKFGFERRQTIRKLKTQSCRKYQESFWMKCPKLKTVILTTTIIRILMNWEKTNHSAQKMKFCLKDFFIKCDQIRRKLSIHSSSVHVQDFTVYIDVSPSIFYELSYEWLLTSSRILKDFLITGAFYMIT